MDTREILLTLKNFAGMEITETDGEISGHGSIMKAYMGVYKVNHRAMEYRDFYDIAKKKLEYLPWECKIVNPRVPKAYEYPTQEGLYITMLDVDEHAVMINRFSSLGCFSVYNKTHVKWWMKLPDDILNKYFIENKYFEKYYATITKGDDIHKEGEVHLIDKRHVKDTIENGLKLEIERDLYGESYYRIYPCAIKKITYKTEPVKEETVEGGFREKIGYDRSERVYD